VPIPFAPLLGFLLGLALAWASRAEFAKEDGPLFTARPVLVAAAFATLVFTPMLGYFAAFHGDWAYLYVVPWRRVPSAVDLALVLLGGASVPVGTFVGAPAARARRLGTLVRMGAGPAVMALALFAWGARRLALSASYVQYHADFGTEPIASSALGRSVLWMGIVAALGVAWSVRAIDTGRRRR